MEIILSSILFIVSFLLWKLHLPASDNSITSELNFENLRKKYSIYLALGSFTNMSITLILTGFGIWLLLQLGLTLFYLIPIALLSFSGIPKIYFTLLQKIKSEEWFECFKYYLNDSNKYDYFKSLNRILNIILIISVAGNIHSLCVATSIFE